MTIAQKGQSGRVCASCEAYRLVHSTFWFKFITPGTGSVVKSICAGCHRLGYRFAENGDTVRGLNTGQAEQEYAEALYG